MRQAAVGRISERRDERWAIVFHRSFLLERPDLNSVTEHTPVRPLLAQEPFTVRWNRAGKCANSYCRVELLLDHRLQFAPRASDWIAVRVGPPKCTAMATTGTLFSNPLTVCVRLSYS